MAVKIRLKRVGTKKKPYYRIVVADSRNARDGKVIEELGAYNPKTVDNLINIDKEKASKWLDNGAQPTDTVRSLLKKAGVIAQVAKEEQAQEAKDNQPMEETDELPDVDVDENIPENPV